MQLIFGSKEATFMRMGNPSMRKLVRRAETGEVAIDSSPATFGGITLKSVYFGVVTIVAALVAAALLKYAVNIQSEQILAGVLIGAACCALPMLIFSLIISFVPRTVKVLGTLYALFQGFLLGVAVYFIDLFCPGVAFAAVLGTMLVFIISVALQRVLSVRVTNKVFRVLIVAFTGLLLVELVMFIMALCGVVSMEFFKAYWWIQLIASAFCVFYAAILLMWDLQSASYIVEIGADKSLEWQVAFSLVTTLVYLYIEILELIVRFAMLFGRNNK